MPNEDSKPDGQPNIVTGEVALIVTPEMLAKIERKHLRRQNRRLLGDELHAKEAGEVDLGEIDEGNDGTKSDE